MGSSRFVQNSQIYVAFTIVDHNDGPLDSTIIYVDMSLYNHAQFIGIAVDSADALTYTLRQTTQDNDGGSDSKDLDITEFYRKEATTDALALAVAQWTRVTQTAAATFTLTAGSGGMVSAEWDAADMDADGGFRWAHVTISDPGNAKNGTGLFILTEPRFPQQTTDQAIT